jgi:hypothetical protein
MIIPPGGFTREKAKRSLVLRSAEHAAFTAGVIAE